MSHVYGTVKGLGDIKPGRRSRDPKFLITSPKALVGLLGDGHAALAAAVILITARDSKQKRHRDRVHAFIATKRFELYCDGLSWNAQTWRKLCAENATNATHFDGAAKVTLD